VCDAKEEDEEGRLRNRYYDDGNKIWNFVIVNEIVGGGVHYYY
jgi:hypothetical protein